MILTFVLEFVGDDPVHPHGRFHNLVLVHALVGFTYQHQVCEQQALHVHLKYMGIHYLCTAGPVCNMSSWVVKKHLFGCPKTWGNYVMLIHLL